MKESVYESRQNVQPLLSRLCHGAKGSHLDQWNRMKNSEIDPDKYAQLILKKFYLFIFGFLGLNCRVRAFSSGEHGLVVVVATTS